MIVALYQNMFTIFDNSQKYKTNEIFKYKVNFSDYILNIRFNLIFLESLKRISTKQYTQNVITGSRFSSSKTHKE